MSPKNNSYESLHSRTLLEMNLQNTSHYDLASSKGNHPGRAQRNDTPKNHNLNQLGAEPVDHINDR